MEPHQLLQKLQTAAAANAERASDCAHEPSLDGATMAQKYAGAALSLTQATVTLQAGDRGRR
jgi:hypothetical protein